MGRPLPPPLPLAPFRCRVPQRSLIRVSGVDAHEYLQGLFTNNLTRLQPGSSLWGCFLYFTGRVLCDAYLYQARQVYQGQASVLIDVHHDRSEALREHLVEMKMRKKVKIEEVSDTLAVVACLERGDGCTSSTDTEAKVEGETAAASATLSELLAESFLDPRSSFLFPSGGVASSSSAGAWVLRKRITPLAWAPSLQPVFTEDPGTSLTGLTSTTSTSTTSNSSSATNAFDEGATDEAKAGERDRRRAVAETFCEQPYKTLLLANGIGEGPAVFRDNKTLPFELNTDFLDGVSFHKGCYVGQELTHRTHVMLVTRKRSVPLYFPASLVSSGAAAPAAESFVGEGLYVNGGKDKVGEVTAGQGTFGLGLLRLRYVDKETRTIADLSLKDGRPVVMHLPSWWPPKQIKKLLKNN